MDSSSNDHRRILDRETIELDLSHEEARDLDAWIARQSRGDLTRPEAVRRLMLQAMAVDREWEQAKRAAKPDEGMRPEELNAENDG